MSLEIKSLKEKYDELEKAQEPELKRLNKIIEDQHK
jgi:hypothetical protein